jgi:hypothetical protein
MGNSSFFGKDSAKFRLSENNESLFSLSSVRNLSNPSGKKRIHSFFFTRGAAYLCIIVIGGAVRLIDGRSPQAIIISQLFPQLMLENYGTSCIESLRKLGIWQKITIFAL